MLQIPPKQEVKSNFQRLKQFPSCCLHIKEITFIFVPRVCQNSRTMFPSVKLLWNLISKQTGIWILTSPTSSQVFFIFRYYTVFKIGVYPHPYLIESALTSFFLPEYVFLSWWATFHLWRCLLSSHSSLQNAPSLIQIEFGLKGGEMPYPSSSWAGTRKLQLPVHQCQFLCSACGSAHLIWIDCEFRILFWAD